MLFSENSEMQISSKKIANTHNPPTHRWSQWIDCVFLQCVGVCKGLSYTGTSSYFLRLCRQNSHFSVIAFSYIGSLTKRCHELMRIYLSRIKPFAGQSVARGQVTRGLSLCPARRLRSVPPLSSSLTPGKSLHPPPLCQRAALSSRAFPALTCRGCNSLVSPDCWTTRMGLEGIMLREVSQRKTNAV